MTHEEALVAVKLWKEKHNGFGGVYSGKPRYFNKKHPECIPDLFVYVKS